MPTCRNCESHVSERYVRVFAPESDEEQGVVRVCPNCPDRVRDGSSVREARSVRQQ